MFRKTVPGVGSGNRKSSAVDGSPSDWRHDQTVSSGRTQSASTRDINSRGERPQIPWWVAVEYSVCQQLQLHINRYLTIAGGYSIGSSGVAMRWAGWTHPGVPRVQGSRVPVKKLQIG